MKTLIELFDTCQVENVIAGLSFLPEKIVFVGFKEIMTEKRKCDLEKFFKMRGIDIKLEFEIVGRYDYIGIYDKLNSIIDRNEDCCFDLTGGKELVLTAMGAVSAMRNLPMLQFDIREDKLLRVNNCNGIPDPTKNSMTIAESVVMNGGAIVTDEKDDFQWDMNADFKKDIEKIWGICKRNCGLWNRLSTVFENMERYGRVDSNFKVSVNISHMRNCHQDTFQDMRTIDMLKKDGLIFDYEQVDDTLSFRYKNAQVHQCLSKAGNILELYTYKTALEIVGNAPDYYDDIDIGVFVDWDGVIHNEESNEKDTRNEIDIILMRGLIPVFISCKNGEVRKEALYELNTVAERIGGEYAKKILLTTYISSDRDSREFILQRARDMKIAIIEGVDKMTRNEFATVLRRHTK